MALNDISNGRFTLAVVKKTGRVLWAAPREKPLSKSDRVPCGLSIEPKKSIESCMSLRPDDPGHARRIQIALDVEVYF